MKGRNAQVSRIYMILNILEGTPQGMTVATMTQRLKDRFFDVTKRTVYRDLEALRAAGFPLDEKGSSEENATRWALDRHAKVGQYLVLESRELLALYLARNVLAPLRDSPFFQDLQSLFSKIEEKLGAKSQAHLGEMQSEIRFETGPISGLGTDSTVVDTVRAACAEQHQLSFTYTSANSQSERTRTVGPHYIYFSRGSLYLVGEDLENQQVKIFSVPRMREAKMLDVTYSGEISDPHVLFEASFGVFKGGKPHAIKLRFARAIAPYIQERRWHESQKLSHHADGSLELSLSASLSPELIQWVLGFGQNVTVLSPPELTERICEEASDLLRRHQPKLKAS